MGCGASTPAAQTFVVNAAIQGQGPEAKADFDKLGMGKKDIDRYFGLFKGIDKDGSGEIDLDEFYRFFDTDRTPFSDRVFSIMDEDGSGEIDFREFVTCLWNFLSFENHALVRFAFTLFDLDGSGALDVSEVRELVMEVYGDSYEGSTRVHRILDRIDADGDGEVSYSEFKEFNRKYPAILFPAFRMQAELRRRVFGEGYWQKQRKERIKMGNGTSASIWEILNAMDANAYAHKMEEMLADEAQQRWTPSTYNGGAAAAAGGAPPASTKRSGAYAPSSGAARQLHDVTEPKKGSKSRKDRKKKRKDKAGKRDRDYAAGAAAGAGLPGQVGPDPRRVKFG